MKNQNDQLLFEMMQLRVQGEADPAGAQHKLGDAQRRGADLELEVGVVAQLESLDLVWRAIESSDDLWEGMPDRLDGKQMQAQNRAIYQEFNRFVLEPYRHGDAAAKKAARAYFKVMV